MKQSFKVSQCQLRHGSAQKTRTKKKKKTQLSTNKHVDPVFTQQPATCHVLTPRSLCDTGFIFLYLQNFCETQFFHWTLWWSFPRSLGWGGRWVRKNIFLTPVLCDPPFSSFSHPNHTGGGEKPGHATTTGKPNRQLGYPGQLKAWFAGIRYDPRQLMKRSKKGRNVLLQ